jgi:hypothetical protein
MNKFKIMDAGLMLATFLAVFCLPRSVQAATVALYDFGTGAGTLASSDTDANSTASSIAFSSALSTAGSGISTSSGNPVDSLFLKGANNSSESAAFTAGKYITLTITPVSGTLSFSSLSFDYRRDVSQGPTSYALYASTTGSFTSGSHLDVNPTAFTVGGTSFTNYSVDLSGISSLQNVASAIQFRLYAWGAADTTNVLRLDNITLNTAAVPEPETWTLLAGGAAGLALLRCRRNGKRPAC